MNTAALQAMMWAGTPLVATGDRLLCKLEGVGPNPAHKSRSAAWLLRQADARGIDISRVADRTSGSWAMGLAAASRAMGGISRFVCVGEPEPVVRAVVEANGGSFMRVPANAERITALERLRAVGWWSPDQHNNPAVIDAFENTLGVELASDLIRLGVGKRELAFVVAPMGTGGTLAGVSRALRRVGFTGFKTAGVDVASSMVHGGPRTWVPEGLKVPGVGSLDEYCGTLRVAMRAINLVLTASAYDALDAVNRFFALNPYSCGMSSGLALAATERYLLPQCPKNKRILVIMPDGAWRYATHLAAASAIFGRERKREDSH
jgi:cysteine synthase